MRQTQEVSREHHNTLWSNISIYYIRWVVRLRDVTHLLRKNLSLLSIHSIRTALNCQQHALFFEERILPMHFIKVLLSSRQWRTWVSILKLLSVLIFSNIFICEKKGGPTNIAYAFFSFFDHRSPSMNLWIGETAQCITLRLASAGCWP